LTVLTIVVLDTHKQAPPSHSDLVTGQWRSHPHGKIFPAAGRNQYTTFTKTFHTKLELPDPINLVLAELLGQFYPLRGAVMHDTNPGLYNLTPITPYLDENLTTLPTHTYFLSIEISRLKNSTHLPKQGIPKPAPRAPFVVRKQKSAPFCTRMAVQTPSQ
jgi:hypothetical protein